MNKHFFLSLCLKKLKKKQHCKIKFSLFLSLQTIELDPIDFTIVIHSHINFLRKVGFLYKKSSLNPTLRMYGCLYIQNDLLTMYWTFRHSPLLLLITITFEVSHLFFCLLKIITYLLIYLRINIFP